MNKLRRLPSQAEIARAIGSKAMGPLGDDRRRDAAIGAAGHGPLGEAMIAGAATEEEREAVLRRLAAVRLELGAAGPCARHLAETAASCLRRAARAEAMARDLEAALEAKGGTVAEALLADPAARATMALVHRWGREADADLRRTLDALRRLHAARLAGLLPSGEQAFEAEARLDAALSADDPGNDNLQPEQAVAEPDPPAAGEPPAPRPAPNGPALLRAYRAQRTEDAARRFWNRLRPDQQAAANDAARVEGAARRA